uniref:Uncharacterized protein n=1 Tax=Myoviridae sp. ctBCv9 TaxID=2825045 RepID=A0A8S5U6N1_9CAUD|nr:MAG TPA: hypothetical protein [Myoviridae sp. ctBCv9]
MHIAQAINGPHYQSQSRQNQKRRPLWNIQHIETISNRF